jgi:hypothetical protein
MWRRVALVRAEVSEELDTFIFRVEKLGERGKASAAGYGGDTYLRSVSSHNTYTEAYPRRRHYSVIISLMLVKLCP